MQASGSDFEGGWANPSPEQIRKFLIEIKTIAVVGLSSNPDRPSNRIGKYLMEEGYRVIPVNPNEPEVLGEKSYSDLKSIPEPVDLVDVFRKSDAALFITEEAIKIGSKGVWLQETVISPEAFRRGVGAGLFMVMDRCIYKEHSRLMK
jgi:predicted CoA-binding protein